MCIETLLGTHGTPLRQALFALKRVFKVLDQVYSTMSVECITVTVVIAYCTVSGIQLARYMEEVNCVCS